MKENSKSFFLFRQNNSGGRFQEPAVEVFVEAETLDEACESTKSHFTLCVDTGMYADYDNCGCCPCCGHRWDKPYSEDPLNKESIEFHLANFKVSYMGSTQVALITKDGLIFIGDSESKLSTIKKYMQ